MNAGKQPILVVNQACGCTVTQVTEQFKSAGYAVVQSFDLLSAMDTRTRCICQLVVLLIYGKDGPPGEVRGLVERAEGGGEKARPARVLPAPWQAGPDRGKSLNRR